MSHVIVPSLSVGNISTPAQPSDPPNVQDVMDAMRLAARVHESYRHTRESCSMVLKRYSFALSQATASRSSQPKVKEDDLVKAKIYEHQVIHAAAFTLHQDDIRAIVTRAVTDAISPVNARLEAMEHRLDAMEHRLMARLDELVEVSYQVGYSWLI